MKTGHESSFVTKPRALLFVTVALLFFWIDHEVLAQTLTKTSSTSSTTTREDAASSTTLNTGSTSTSTDTSTRSTSTSDSTSSSSTSTDTSSSSAWYSLEPVSSLTSDTSSTNATADTVSAEYDSAIFYRGGAFNLGLSSSNQARRLTGVGLYQSQTADCQSENFSAINDHPAVENHSAIKGIVSVVNNSPALDGYKWRVYSQGLIYKKNTLWSKSVSLYTNSNAMSRIQNVSLDFVTSSKPKSSLVYLAILKGFKIYDTHFDANLLNGFGVKTLWFNLSAPVLSADGQSVDVTVIPSVSSFEGAVSRLQAEVYFDVIAYDPEHWGHKGISWFSADGAIQSTTDTGENKYFYRYHNLDLGMALNSLDQVFVSFYKYGFNTSSTLPFEWDKFWAAAAPTALNGNQLQVKLSGMVYGHQGALPTDPEKYLNPTELKGYAIYCKDPETCRVSFAGSGTGTTNWDSVTYLDNTSDALSVNCASEDLVYNITNEAVALSSSTDSSVQLASSTDTSRLITDTSSGDADSTPTSTATTAVKTAPSQTTTDTSSTTTTDSSTVTLQPVDRTTDTTISITDTDSSTTPTRDVTLVAVDTTDTGQTTDSNSSVDSTLTVQQSDADLFPESQVTGYSGTPVTILSNLDMEIWDPTGNKPKFFSFWRRYYKDFGDSFVDYNTFATLSHDSQVKHGEMGYSLKIKMDDVTYGQGAAVVSQAITDKTRILPNRSYEFSTYMKTQDFGGEPQIAIQIRYKKKDGSNGYKEFAVKGMRGTHEWTKFSVVGTTPPESEVLEFTSVTFAVAAYAYPEDEKGPMWTDDWVIKEYQSYGDIEMSTSDTVYVSPDVVTQAPVSVLSKGNVWTLNAAGKITGPIQMILDLPDGITLVGTQAKRTALPTPVATTIMGMPYQRYVLEYPQVSLNHYSEENLLLQSRWSNGQKGTLFLATKWNGGERTAHAYPVEAVAIPVAQQPEYLKTSVLSWGFPAVKETWPNLLTLLKRIGAQGFTFDMIDFRRFDVQPHVQTFMGPAQALGLDVTARYSPFYKTMTAFTDAELARRADGTIADGRANAPFMCPALRTGNYLQELGIFNEAAKRGINWFDFDFEGEAHGMFCSGAFEEFKSRHPEFASASPAAATPPRDSNYNDLIDDVASASTLSVDEKIYDAKDAAWLEFQTDKGAELWKSVYASILDGLAESGSQELPTMFTWRTSPGMVYSSYSDYDKMRAEFPISANIEMYLGYGGNTLPHAGKYIRRVLLGVYSADAENLEINPGFETATDASGAFPPKGYTSQDSAGISYVDLNAGAGRTLHGARSIKMTTAGKKLSRVINDLKAGESYVFGVGSFRSRRGMEGCIELSWLDAQGQALSDGAKDCGPTFEGQWQRLAVYETMPENAVAARLDLYAQGSADRGAVWFDDVHVVRPNLVENASFEEGSTSLTGFKSSVDAVLVKPISFAADFAHHGQRSAKIKNADAVSPGLVTTVPVKEHFPYEFSAYVAAPQNGSVQLDIEWLDENSQSTGTQQKKQFAVSAAEGWQQFVFSANSPAGAVSARVSVLAKGSEGDLLYVDDLRFRVDGAYVIPYITAGYRGSDFDHEISAEKFQDLLLESFVAGAEGHASYPGNGWSGKDMAVFANTNNMLAPVEDIIANGTAIPQSRLQPTNASFQVRGMELGDDALILVSYYGRAAGSTTVTFDKAPGGSLSEIHHDGSVTPVSALAEGQSSFGVSIDPSMSGHHTKLYVFEHSKTALTFPEEPDSTEGVVENPQEGEQDFTVTPIGDGDTADTTTGGGDTGDTTVQPDDRGLLDKIVDVLTGGDDTGSGDTTTGGDTTGGDTSKPPVDSTTQEPSAERGKFFVANENDDDGTRPVGVGEFRADGGHLRSHAQTVDVPTSPMTSMAGLAQIGSTIYATGRDLYNMDLNVGTFNRFTIPGYDEHGENVNALCRYNGQLVIVSSAGGWIHSYDPVGNVLHHGVAGGFDSPQGCKQVGGELFVIDREKIYRLEKCGDGFVSEVFFELDSVDPSHFSEGGLEAKGGHLFYTNHAPDWNTGHLVAVDMATRQGQIVVPIERNPRGLAIDPQGEYIYVSQLTNASVVKVRLDKTLNYLTGAVSTPPLVEPFITDATNLAGPFGLLWVEEPSSTLTVTEPRGDLCGDEPNRVDGGDTTGGEENTGGEGTTEKPIENPELGYTVDCAEGYHMVNETCVPDSTTTTAVCGNGVVDPYEACDDALPAPEGFVCRDCHLKPVELATEPTPEPAPEDTSKTEPVPEPAPVDDGKTDVTATCPNGILETGEECEVAREEDGDRIFIGFDPHTEICTSDCLKHTIVVPPEQSEQSDDCGPKDLVCPGDKIFKTDGCHNWCEDFTVTVTPAPTGEKESVPAPERLNICGNGKKEGTEQCDGRDGIRFSTEVCTQDCQIVQLVPDPQETTPVCGNAVLEMGEQCDQDVLKGLSVGFDPQLQSCENCEIKLLPKRLQTPDEDEEGDQHADLVDETEDEDADTQLNEEESVTEDDESSDFCGDGKLDEGEECDPAQITAEGEGLTVRICNYRCQFVTLVLSCDHDHDHDHATSGQETGTGTGASTPTSPTTPPAVVSSTSDSAAQSTTASTTPTSTPAQTTTATSGTTAGTTTAVTPDTGVSPQPATTPVQPSSTAAPESQPQQPWGGFGLGGGSCQLAKSAGELHAETGIFTLLLFGVSFLFVVILRRQTRR